MNNIANSTTFGTSLLGTSRPPSPCLLVFAVLYGVWTDVMAMAMIELIYKI